MGNSELRQVQARGAASGDAMKGFGPPGFPGHSCKTCAHALQLSDDPDEPLQCRRFPPVPLQGYAIGRTSISGTQSFPAVYGDQWCGEFRLPTGSV